MPAEMLSWLTGLADNGVLPAWADWFGAAAIRELVPDESKRALIAKEMPRVPLGCLPGSVPAVHAWPTVRNGHLRISAAYDAEAREARQRDWPVIELDGGHLDLVTAPVEIADAILALLTAP